MEFTTGVELEPHEKVLKEVKCSLDQLMGEKGRLMVTTQRIIFAVTGRQLGGQVLSIPATKLAGVEVTGNFPKHLKVTALTEHGQAAYSFTNWVGTVAQAYEAVKALIYHYSGTYSKELREATVETRLSGKKSFKEKLGLFFVGLGVFMLFLWLWLPSISVTISLEFVIVGLLLMVHGKISVQAEIKKLKAEAMEYDLLIEKSMQYAGELSSQPVEPLETRPAGETLAVKEREKPARKEGTPVKTPPKGKTKKPEKEAEKRLEEELKRLRKELGVGK